MDKNLESIIAVSIFAIFFLSMFFTIAIVRLTPPKIKVVTREKKITEKVYVDRETKVQYTIDTAVVKKLSKIYNIPSESAKYLPDKTWEALSDIHQEILTDKVEIRELTTALVDTQKEFDHMKRLMRFAFDSEGGKLYDGLERKSRQRQR